MEAATLTSPQRKFSVVPVQKSLSLPSYARAGGGGIDHRLIFEALEKKEKGRRKSKLFTREKKNTRQTNIFCLPIPSSRHDKCRETSFSSDTSCSSLEYQKPKKAEPKQAKTNPPNETVQQEIAKKPNVTRAYSEVRTSEVRSSEVRTSELRSSEVRSSGIRSSEVRSPEGRPSEVRSISEVKSVEVRRSPIDNVVRLNVGSSDSMERSSRSSTDSFSRKERLVAIKARVEAEREKYGVSSSDEESCSTLTRYNSDGSIHRSATREVKSKSSRTERRLRRRSQGEWSIQPNFSCSKANRKKSLNLSLLKTEDNGIQLSLERPSRINNDVDHLDIKTDFCPSPNFPDLMKKNYFSDFPSRENSARFVQARIRLIEDEERKRRSGSDFREKVRTPPRQSPQNLENTSPASIERRFQFDKQNSSASNSFERNTSIIDSVGRGSPLPRATQAPTPPPRSPKSMTFVNKAFIQHQNASLRKKEKTLDQIKCSENNISGTSYTDIFEQFNAKSDISCNDRKFSVESLNNSSDKQKFRELINNRRKTCGNFDFIDKNILDDLCSIKSPVDSSNSIVAANKKFSSVMQIKGQEAKNHFSGSETPCAPLQEDVIGKQGKNKWQENEQRREYMFNSLESKKPNPSPWTKLKSPPKVEACLCRLFPEEKFMCICKSDLQEKNDSIDVPFVKKDISNPSNEKNICILPIRNTPDRLSKSEVNIATKERDKISMTRLNKIQVSPACTNSPVEVHDIKNVCNGKKTASDNLESAMEELESVYRSLKFSSDNLSDLNSVSNASLSDDGSKTSKLEANDCFIKLNSDFKRRSSVCETHWKADTNKISINIGEPDKNAFKKFSVTSSPSYPTPKSSNRTPDTNELSIDELFNNMTLQLGHLEQSFLNSPNGQSSEKTIYEPSRLDSNTSNNNNLSKISIRKQFYDNLCKGNQNQTKSHAHTVSANGVPDTNICVDKKKHKAVRSLSNNISYLMTSPESTRHNKFASNADEANGHTSHTPLQEQPCKERAHFDSSTPGSTFKQSNIFSKTDGCTTQHTRREDIRQIRVSMDSNFNPSHPTASDSFQESRQYPRLSSALSSPGKSEGIPISPEANPACTSFQETKHYPRLGSARSSPSKSESAQDTEQVCTSFQESKHYPRLSSVRSSPSKSEGNLVVQEVEPSCTSFQVSKQYPRLSSAPSFKSEAVPDAEDGCKSFQESRQYPRLNYALPSKSESVSGVEQSSIPKDSVDVDGLEQLLNSLLGEVPDRQQSSLVHSSPATPPPSSGEMRVLQHLDVIRLKPVPS